jgi:hypothetical protein
VSSKQEQLELFSSRTHAVSDAMDRIAAANEAIPLTNCAIPPVILNSLKKGRTPNHTQIRVVNSGKQRSLSLRANLNLVGSTCGLVGLAAPLDSSHVLSRRHSL